MLWVQSHLYWCLLHFHGSPGKPLSRHLPLSISVFIVHDHLFHHTVNSLKGGAGSFIFVSPGQTWYLLLISCSINCYGMNFNPFPSLLETLLKQSYFSSFFLCVRLFPLKSNTSLKQTTKHFLYLRPNLLKILSNYCFKLLISCWSFNPLKFDFYFINLMKLFLPMIQIAS